MPEHVWAEGNARRFLISEAVGVFAHRLKNIYKCIFWRLPPTMGAAMLRGSRSIPPSVLEITEGDLRDSGRCARPLSAYAAAVASPPAQR